MDRLNLVKLSSAIRPAGVALGATLALLTGACTLTPWGDNYPPPRASQPPAPGVMAGYYRVNPGDSLGGIAVAFGQRVQDVASWNHLPPTASVSPGQVLRVAPPPVVVSPVPSEPAPVVSEPTELPPAALPPSVPLPSVPLPPVALTLAWPAQGAVTSRFVPGQTRGIVITSSGDPTVRAAAAGRVVYAGSGVASYGPLVILKHENGLITAYGHNGALLVNEGDAVSAGQPIAQMSVDASGRTSFEFEVRQDGKPVDPLLFLPRNGG